MRLGAGEIIVILVLALLFFGPSKLPQLGASLGEAIKGLKKGLSEASNDEKPAVAVPALPAPVQPVAAKPPVGQA
jgi:sec-independent protein translocase protein TatA